MQPLAAHHPWNVRALLEETATPFAINEYKPRAVIFNQGDPCDSVMHVEKGRVWLAVTAQSGREAIFGLVDTGGFLGEEALAGRVERRQSATAMTATQVLVVPKAQMIRLLQAQPGLMNRFVSHLLARNSRLESNLTDLLLYSSEQRLAHTLLLLANCDVRNPCRCALPGLSQEIMAEMVGTTRSRVNAFIGRFKRLGFVEEDQDGALLVNPARLRIAEGDRPRPIDASRAS